MAEASLTFDLRDFERRMDTVQRKQMPYAIMLTLNDAAFGARRDMMAEMNRVFDRPTPYAKRGTEVEMATKRDLEARLVLSGIKGVGGSLPAAYYLGPQVHGGRRSLKAFERQLKAKGLLPDGHVVVPAERTPLDRYGNIPQGQLNRIMAGLAIDYRGAGATRLASTEKGKARSRRKGRYFVPAKGSRLAPGVWFEPGFPLRAVWPVLMFVASPSYAVRLRFYEVVRRHADRNMARYFARNFAKAMRTAR